MKKILTLIMFCLLVNNYQETKYESDAMHYSTMKTFEPNPEGKIKLFSYATCPWCKKVITFLTKINKLDQVVIMDVSNPMHMKE